MIAHPRLQTGEAEDGFLRPYIRRYVSRTFRLQLRAAGHSPPSLLFSWSRNHSDTSRGPATQLPPLPPVPPSLSMDMCESLLLVLHNTPDKRAWSHFVHSLAHACLGTASPDAQHIWDTLHSTPEYNPFLQQPFLHFIVDGYHLVALLVNHFDALNMISFDWRERDLMSFSVRFYLGLMALPPNLHQRHADVAAFFQDLLTPIVTLRSSAVPDAFLSNVTVLHGAVPTGPPRARGMEVECAINSRSSLYYLVDLPDVVERFVDGLLSQEQLQREGRLQVLEGVVYSVCTGRIGDRDAGSSRLHNKLVHALLDHEARQQLLCHPYFPRVLEELRGICAGVVQSLCTTASVTVELIQLLLPYMRLRDKERKRRIETEPEPRLELPNPLPPLLHPVLYGLVRKALPEEDAGGEERALALTATEDVAGSVASACVLMVEADLCETTLGDGRHSLKPGPSHPSSRTSIAHAIRGSDAAHRARLASSGLCADVSLRRFERLGHSAVLLLREVGRARVSSIHLVQTLIDADGHALVLRDALHHLLPHSTTLLSNRRLLLPFVHLSLLIVSERNDVLLLYQTKKGIEYMLVPHATLLHIKALDGAADKPGHLHIPLDRLTMWAGLHGPLHISNAACYHADGVVAQGQPAPARLRLNLPFAGAMHVCDERRRMRRGEVLGERCEAVRLGSLLAASCGGPRLAVTHVCIDFCRSVMRGCGVHIGKWREDWEFDMLRFDPEFLPRPSVGDLCGQLKADMAAL